MIWGSVVSKTCLLFKDKKMKNFTFFLLGQISSFANINDNTIWMQNGITIAGGNGQGNRLNQLSNPHDTYVDDQRIYIADSNNHRIVEWECGAKIGEVVAGGNGQGNRLDQLNYPTSVIFDKNNDSFIICDQGNRRVVQWSRQNDTNAEIIISDIDCNSLATDKNGYLYVSDKEKHEVIIWKTGEINGTIVAGGNGQGNELNQLNYPSYIFVDQDNSLYVSEWNNYRVMKWTEGAEEGIIIISGLQYENILTRFFLPTGITVDPLGNVYVADCSNHRIIRWLKESEEISIVIGENEAGTQSNKFNCFGGVSFDGEGNLYVTDYYNNRILKFDIDSN
jgi:sugar lactone lactonase YvrE